MAVLLDNWDYTLSGTSSPWFVTLGNPSNNISGNFLQITLDDVVERNPLPDPNKQWKIEFDIDFQTGLEVNLVFPIKGMSLDPDPAPYIAWEADTIKLQWGGVFNPFGNWINQTLSGSSVHVEIFAFPETNELQVIAGGVDSGKVVVSGGSLDWAIPLIIGTVHLGNSGDTDAAHVNPLSITTNINDRIKEIEPIKTRTLTDYCTYIANLFPVGLLWNNINKTFKDLIEAIAVEFNRNDLRNVDLQRELIPGLSVELLPDWERVALNEDELDLGGTTIEERQKRVSAKIFNTLGPPTKQFFENLALDNGVTISITFTTGAFRVGVNRVGDRVRGATSVYIWIVDYVAGPTDVYIGLEPTFRRLKHAHTFLIFNAP